MSKKEFEPTQIDLGDDLLDEVPHPKTEASTSTQKDRELERDPEELLKTAEIYFNEGFLEESKHTLRKIILENEHHPRARALLQKIHDLELKQLFKDEEDFLTERNSKKRTFDEKEESTDMVLRRLESELGIDLSPNTRDAISLFPSENSLKAYFLNLKKSASSCGAREWIDLGIGYLEMSLFELAGMCFQEAEKRKLQDAPLLDRLAVELAALRAFAEIGLEHFSEAIVIVDQALVLSEVPEKEKIELLYLKGVANECLSQFDQALFWFERCRVLGANYRDVEAKVSSLRSKGR